MAQRISHTNKCSVAQLSADYTSQSASYEKAKSHEAELARQLAMAQERCEALRAECEARTAALEGAQMRLREALASQTASCQQWEAQLSSAQVGLAQTVGLGCESMAHINRGYTCLKGAVEAETAPCKQWEAQLALMQVVGACCVLLVSRSHRHPLLSRSRAMCLPTEKHFLVKRYAAPAFKYAGVRPCRVRGMQRWRGRRRSRRRRRS